MAWYGKYESLDDFDDWCVPPSSHVPPHQHTPPYPPFELPLREDSFDEFVEGILSNPLEVNLAAQAEKERIDVERAARLPSNYEPKKIIVSRDRINPANWPVIKDENGNDVSVHPSVIVALSKEGKPPVIVSRGKWPGDLDTHLKFLQDFQTAPLDPMPKELTKEDIGWVRRLLEKLVSKGKQ